MKQFDFNLWKKQHATFCQFIKYALLSCITTVVELGSLMICNFWVFTSFKNKEFSWWLIDYSVENGGMTALMAFAVSFALSQIFNFFLHRKATFKANNNLAMSAVMYAFIVIIVYIVQLYVPTIIRAYMVHYLGAFAGDLLTKIISMTSSMLIQFPANKFLIMHRLEKKESKIILS